jgi:hypothetical protein
MACLPFFQLCLYSLELLLHLLQIFANVVSCVACFPSLSPLLDQNHTNANSKDESFRSEVCAHLYCLLFRQRPYAWFRSLFCLLPYGFSLLLSQSLVMTVGVAAFCRAASATWSSFLIWRSMTAGSCSSPSRMRMSIRCSPWANLTHTLRKRWCS